MQPGQILCTNIFELNSCTISQLKIMKLQRHRNKRSVTVAPATMATVDAWVPPPRVPCSKGRILADIMRHLALFRQRP